MSGIPLLVTHATLVALGTLFVFCLVDQWKKRGDSE